ncbi:MAG TPA: hypothetical protein ENN09_04150, partial [Planctomycetes bacterium]|nr:hypothetical protein [Planctomycetota bacterium]
MGNVLLFGRPLSGAPRAGGGWDWRRGGMKHGSTVMSKMQGTMVAIVTPFKDGGVDRDKFAGLCERQVKAGVEAIVPTGTTGESATLTHEEHHEVIVACVENVKGRAKVYAGAGSNSTDEAVDLTRFAEKAGCDGTLHVSPYYNKPSDEGIYRHLEAVAKASPLPVIIYN